MSYKTLLRKKMLEYHPDKVSQFGGRVNTHAAQKIGILKAGIDRMGASNPSRHKQIYDQTLAQIRDIDRVGRPSFSPQKRPDTTPMKNYRLPKGFYQNGVLFPGCTLLILTDMRLWCLETIITTSRDFTGPIRMPSTGGKRKSESQQSFIAERKGGGEKKKRSINSTWSNSECTCGSSR